MNTATLDQFRSAMNAELEDLLSWWANYTVDQENGGFYGQIDNQNQANAEAPKGLVLNARILYTFSSAFLLQKKASYLELAHRAFDYLTQHFADTAYGGFYWSVDAKGQLLDGRKQIYGQAFAIYALAEYYKATANPKALNLAKATFRLIELYSFDADQLGYFEAFTREWANIADQRLSAKDQNEKKTMNTHLHVIEAYTNLYGIWPNEILKKAIKQLLQNFSEHIIHPQHFHLQLFFDNNWQVKSTLVSFGHDIEASWLLEEAAHALKNDTSIVHYRQLALQMANASLKGLDENGALWYEYDTANGHWIKELHWWPQAEAMVGFFNAWQISGQEHFLRHTLQVWDFVKKHLKDPENGEWFWGLHQDYSPMLGEDKAGFWKCPYHNGRACMELLKRIDSLRD
ncbi:AGE family epimerase/isomerase [Pedobacter sp. KR3-3]|uniref:Cellobiose 2-epimerase n=1 Tax=Pedobacter albus TaxID=3113905 RepID=A0ABU7I8K8_9SPHI|nr:AGE family epimerase/isomerase [Pedobacter sp. KR3-3]MEE1945796.1 AGE family epimerase/isomerase [Pedobacter sp. KR3-3]